METRQNKDSVCFSEVLVLRVKSGKIYSLNFKTGRKKTVQQCINSGTLNSVSV